MAQQKGHNKLMIMYLKYLFQPSPLRETRLGLSSGVLLHLQMILEEPIAFPAPANNENNDCACGKHEIQ